MLAKLGLNTSAPYHFIFYSVVFGGSIFHSFVVSPIAFKHLKREEFSKLQSEVFPIYFLGQTVAPAVLALSTPLTLCPFTIGLLALSGLAGAFNYLYLTPVCHKIKDERKKLEAEKKHETVVDGQLQNTEEYTKLNKKFGTYHGLSMLTNLVSIVSLGLYGVVLSKRLIRV